MDSDIPITASVPGAVNEGDEAIQPTTTPDPQLEEEGQLSQEELQKLGEALKSMTKESALSDVKVWIKFII